jgi:hypothetical protein
MRRFDFVDNLKRRLKNWCDISIDYSFNYPFIYLDSINSQIVIETNSQHGFVVVILSVKRDNKTYIPDTSALFKLIRKYK